MTGILVGVAIGVLLLGLMIGAVIRGRLLLPGDRRRLDVITARLQAEARIDALTRSTIQAMHDAVRGRGGPPA